MIRICTVAALAVFIPCAIQIAVAAETPAYPTRPIRFIMPYPVGGTIDMSGRMVAQAIGEGLGQQVVVDNRTGAGGTLGTEVAAKSPPDGYTILMGGTGTLAISPSLDRKLGYDPLRDFSPITLLATTPYVLVVHPTVAAASTRELIALAKAQPGKLNYASGGSGSAPHLLGEIFRTRAVIDVMHIPYKGSTPAKIDLVAGRVQMFFTGIPPVIGEIRAGTLRAVGVTTAKRTQALPDVPTIAESGIAGFDVSPWFGVLAPAHTSPAIVARLNAEMVKALRNPTLRERLTRDGVDAVGNTPQAFGTFIRTEMSTWAQAVKQSGAKVE
ncbi:MAG TPA: tripartite tricarboxylate transporter substrate binding protein [Burkholderiales bacterium]|nr:tripartite tricarboxylate transporter substrate binding protein [Burkholderiales bacterium]